MSTTIIIYIVFALLVAFALYSVINKARGKSRSSCCGTPEVKTVRKVSDRDESHYPYRYQLSIDGMQCSNCARSVENELNSMEGVWSRIDLGRKEALVRCKSEQTEEDFVKALRTTPYTVTEMHALK